MADRDRLIELLNIAVGDCNLTDPEIKIVADYLLANGVIVPPCKVGDAVWELLPEQCRYRVKDMCSCYCDGFDADAECYRGGLEIHRNEFKYSMIDKIGKTVFLTKEEAEKALKEREGNG